MTNKPNIIKLFVCVPHKTHDCKICSDYLNGPLMQPFKDNVRKHKKNRMTEEELQEQRDKVHQWENDNYTYINVVEPKEIFSELGKCISQHTKYDQNGVKIGTFDYMDWWEFKELKKKYGVD